MADMNDDGMLTDENTEGEHTGIESEEKEEGGSDGE